MADTHGVLRPEVEKILETCDVIVHAGDFDTQMLYMKLSGKQPLFAVRGNNDRGWSGGLPGIKRFEIGGVKMVMAHQRTDIPVALGDAQVVIFWPFPYVPAAGDRGKVVAKSRKLWL